MMHSNPNEAVWQTPASHWCPGCWHWVVDCRHVVDLLRLPHRAVKDIHVKSLAYDPPTGRLEAFFLWKEAVQFSPVSVSLFRELLGAEGIIAHLQPYIKERHITWNSVRTELVIGSVLRKGLQLLTGEGNQEGRLLPRDEWPVADSGRRVPVLRAVGVD